MRVRLRLRALCLALALAAGARGAVAQDAPKPPPQSSGVNQMTPAEALRRDSILAQERDAALARARDSALAATAAPSPDLSVPRATRPAAARPVPEAELQRFAEDPGHQYARAAQERPSWWDLFWRRFWQKVAELFTSEGAQPFWTYVAPALGVLLLAWGLSRLIRGEGSGLFGRRDRKAPPEVGPLLDVEDIATVDLDRLLADARREGRERDVVRYRFLLALQRLSAAGAVVWRKDRTNRDYLFALRHSAPEAAPAFEAAARVFSWVWYGEYALDPAAAVAAAERMDRLDAALQRLRVVAPEREAASVADEVYE